MRGRVYSFASCTVTRPRWVTVSPHQSARMTSTASASVALRSARSGQGAPVMASLSASPLPTAIHMRSGNISPSVATAWATIAG